MTNIGQKILHASVLSINTTSSSNTEPSDTEQKYWDIWNRTTDIKWNLRSWKSHSLYFVLIVNAESKQSQCNELMLMLAGLLCLKALKNVPICVCIVSIQSVSCYYAGWEICIIAWISLIDIKPYSINHQIKSSPIWLFKRSWRPAA